MTNSTTTLYPVTPGTIYFIGAGPGAPDLMTIRARDIIAQSDLVLYADSLVDERVGDFAPPRAEVVGSLKMHLELIMERMITVAQRGGVVARVHSGDPALYGATHEQMVRLEAAGGAGLPGVDSSEEEESSSSEDVSVGLLSVLDPLLGGPAQSLHWWRCLPCEQIPAPPQSLHV